MTRVAHFLAAVLTLLVAWQPVAAALPDQMVCRFTGKVVQADCPCPESGERRAELARQSCCELRSAPDEAAPGEVPSTAARAVPVFAALPGSERTCARPVVAAGSLLPVLDSSPPGVTRLFVRLRHLLI